MFSRLFALILVLCLVIAASATPQTEIADSEQLQVNPPTVRRIPPPDRNLPADQLEQRADQLRSQKLYVDALDYYHAALSKKPDSGVLYNKMGITELLSQRLREAARDTGTGTGGAVKKRSFFGKFAGIFKSGKPANTPANAPEAARSSPP